MDTGVQSKPFHQKVKNEKTTTWLIPNLVGEAKLPNGPVTTRCGTLGVFGDLVNPAATDSFVCSGLVSALSSIHIRAVFAADWHFARNLAGLRAGYSAIIRSVCFYSHRQIRSL